MALAVVQTAVSAPMNGWINLTATFAAPPALGNAVLVFVQLKGAGAAGVTSVTDNQGNTYTLAIDGYEVSNVLHATIYYCPIITVTGASFVITANFPGFGNATGAAVEVSGVTAAGLALLTTSTATMGAPGTLTPTTGPAATLSVTNVILAAINSYSTGGTACAVVSASPAWVSALEQLSNAYGSGESDTRILTSGSGVTPSCDWTWAAAGPSQWAGAIAAFGDGTVVATVAVPNVVGLLESAATSALTAVGLTVGTVTGTGVVVSQSPIAGTSVAVGSTVDLTLAPPSPTPVILIESEDQTPRVRATFSLDVTYTLGSRAVARFETVDYSTDSTVDAFHPDVEETVDLWHLGTQLYSGMILGQDVRALGDPARGVVTALTASDFTMALERRLVTKDYLATDGWTLKTVVDDLVDTYLTSQGITLDPAMATGPAIPADLHYDGVTMQAALTDLATMSGWVFRLTPAKVLEMFEVGTKVAPFELSTDGGAILGGVSWRKSRSSYVNRVCVRIGGTTRMQVPVSWTGDDVTTVFPLDFPVALKYDPDPPGPEYRYWVVDAQPIVVEQPGDLYYPIYADVDADTFIEWDFDIPGNALIRWEPLPIGTTASWWYWAQFPHDVCVEDAADITSRGAWEERIERADIFTIAEATAIGDGILAQRGPGATPRVVSIRTRNAPAFPGDVIPLDVPERELTGDWLITQTRISQWTNEILQYDYECLEGGVAHVSWIDYLRNLWGTRIATPPAQPEVPALGRRRPRVGTRRRS